MNSIILITMFCLLFMLTVVARPDSTDNSKAAGAAGGMIVGIIIILGIWRYFYFENRKKVERGVIHDKTVPIAHRIEH